VVAFELGWFSAEIYRQAKSHADNPAKIAFSEIDINSTSNRRARIRSSAGLAPAVREHP